MSIIPFIPKNTPDDSNPYKSFFINADDILINKAHLSNTEKGVYFELLSHYHFNANSLKNDDKIPAAPAA